MLLFPAVLIVMMVLLRAQLKRFQGRIPQIRSESDLEHLRRLATVQMYGGLFSPLLWLPFLVWIYGKFVANELAWADLLKFGILPFLCVSAAAFALGGPAKEVQDIAVADSRLKPERDRIVDVWLHKKLPKW
jgi:hypothetical protein